MSQAPVAQEGQWLPTPQQTPLPFDQMLQTIADAMTTINPLHFTCARQFEALRTFAQFSQREELDLDWIQDPGTPSGGYWVDQTEDRVYVYNYPELDLSRDNRWQLDDSRVVTGSPLIFYTMPDYVSSRILVGPDLELTLGEGSANSNLLLSETTRNIANSHQTGDGYKCLTRRPVTRVKWTDNGGVHLLEPEDPQFPAPDPAAVSEPDEGYVSEDDDSVASDPEDEDPNDLGFVDFLYFYSIVGPPSGADAQSSGSHT